MDKAAEIGTKSRTSYMTLVAVEQPGMYLAYQVYPVYAWPRAATELTTRSELPLAFCALYEHTLPNLTFIVCVTI